MKNKIIILLIFIVPLFGYHLLTNYINGKMYEQAATAAEKIPHVIIFSTPMCGECKKFAPVADLAQKRYEGLVKIEKINALENNARTIELVKKHRIFLVPTLVYLDKNGKVISRSEGSMTYEQFDSKLKKLITAE